ncbi:hypothetical protein AB0G02_18435 [Actinosynnema sp. NPDC023658]|uniref:hypothetical protein n=1 Tax=Actinosynnema sp. NPDC023658 TaxID=3155465 RepID=UPI0033D743B6
MSVQQTLLPAAAAAEEQSALEALMVEPEAGVSDAPRYVEVPQAKLKLLALLSPPLPKESKH